MAEPGWAGPPPATEREQHLYWAKALFNDTWRLMDLDTRTSDQDDQMINQAHASMYHWSQVGKPVNIARGHWQCSRVYCVLGRAEPALHHAHRVLDICRREGIGDWDLGYAYEAMARAYAVAGDPEQARAWLDQARAASTEIAESDDRELLLSDLDTIPVPPRPHS